MHINPLPDSHVLMYILSLPSAAYSVMFRTLCKKHLNQSHTQQSPPPPTPPLSTSLPPPPPPLFAPSCGSSDRHDEWSQASHLRSKRLQNETIAEMSNTMNRKNFQSLLSFPPPPRRGCRLAPYTIILLAMAPAGSEGFR